MASVLYVRILNLATPRVYKTFNYVVKWISLSKPEEIDQLSDERRSKQMRVSGNYVEPSSVIPAPCNVEVRAS